MAPLTNAQISIDRWSKLLLIGCVLLIMVSGHAFFGCGHRHSHHHGPRGAFHGSHPDVQNDAAVSFAVAGGDSAHASASFSLSLSNGEPEQQPDQGATSELRGRGFRPNHRGGHHFGARHGRHHHSHSHEQQKPEQQPEQQPEILPAVNAGTFDVKIQPARILADIKMPEAPRAVAIPLDLPAVDTVAEAGVVADSSKPEPRPRHHHERRILPRRAFRPDHQQQQEQQPQQLPLEQQPQQQEQQPQQKEGQMEQFPVIVDDLQQPMVDPIPPVFMKDGEQKALPHPHPHPHGFGGKKGCCCAQRRLAGLGLATGATGVIAAFRPSRCGVALFLVGVLVVEVLMLLRVSTHVIQGMERCMDGARNVDEINACGDFGRRAGITATLIIGVIAASFASCGARLGRGVVAREQEERVEAEAGAISHAIIAGASVPIVVGSCDLAPLPAYVLAVEGTACVDAEEQQGGACSV